MFCTNPNLPFALDSLFQIIQFCVQYVRFIGLTQSECRPYYDYIVDCEASQYIKINENHISTYKLFHHYCTSYNKLCLVESGWVRASITLELGGETRTGCYRCPLQLMKQLFIEAGGISYLIPFQLSTNENVGEHRENHGTRRYTGLIAA